MLQPTVMNLCQASCTNRSLRGVPQLGRAATSTGKRMFLNGAQNTSNTQRRTHTINLVQAKAQTPLTKTFPGTREGK